MLCAARGQSPGLQPAHATPTSFQQVLEDAHLHLSLPPLLSHLPWASCYPLYPVFSPIHPFPLVLVMLFNPLDKPIVKVAQLCPTLHPSPWNSPGQNAGVRCHSLLQGTFQPRDQTQVSRIAGRFFTS